MSRGAGPSADLATGRLDRDTARAETTPGTSASGAPRPSRRRGGGADGSTWRCATALPKPRSETRAFCGRRELSGASSRDVRSVASVSPGAAASAVGNAVVSVWATGRSACSACTLPGSGRWPAVSGSVLVACSVAWVSDTARRDTGPGSTSGAVTSGERARTARPGHAMARCSEAGRAPTGPFPSS
jgi:hypothetical protein